MLTAQRIQERMDDAVERGRMTRKDAEDLAKGLLEEGRKQTAAFLADIEQLLGRSRSDIESAASTARSAASTARKRARTTATQRGDRVLREVDKARRTVGVGPSFPILGYDELSAGQVTARLRDLQAAQLRKIRDYERRNGNRKSVLGAVEKALS
jgi:polyhydroxyalkanoate synthesis regulator phasin